MTDNDGRQPEENPKLIARIPAAVGASVISVLRHSAGLTLLTFHTLVALARPRRYYRALMTQMYDMGIGSIPVVVLVAALAGAVTSQQSGYQFTGTVPIWVIGSVVAASVLTELGPLVTALVLVGRIGARIGAELGTMVVTEQVDALRAVGRDPVEQLVVPRVLAGTLMLPPLVVLADFVGIASGWFGALLTLPITSAEFVYGVRTYFHDFALWFGLIKAAVFGATITFIGCYVGLRATGGAEGVGRTTTSVVVSGTVAIMFWDAVLARLLKAFG
ncbi:MAG: ABC transporter permease [Gemmatimonadales bacterium]|jgi:phospholipid/cholesterol/gamma-HCH transport system permease protein